MARVTFALFLAVFMSLASIGMDKECATELCTYIESRYSQTINKDLLKAIAAPNSKKLLTQIQDYYIHQPAHQKTYIAFLSKPWMNIKKCSAYLALIRATSLDVRESIPEDELENEAVDAKIMPQVRKEWPIVSARYDLQEMQQKINKFREWMMGFSGTTNLRSLQEFLKKLTNDYAQISQAITICSNYKEHLNKCVSFEDNSE
jgi:hypothetical protein